VLLISTMMLVTQVLVVVMSLPIMCPISLASLGTTLLMVMTLMYKRKNLGAEKVDKFGYSGPKSINNNKQAFKKFI